MTRDARQSAEHWLSLVDAGNYAGSWQQAGTAFRSAVTAEQWAHSSSSARRPLGEVQKRSVRETRATKSLPGVADGQYVVVLFDTAFSNKAIAVETVTTALEPDGSWKVVGYFVR